MAGVTAHDLPGWDGWDCRGEAAREPKGQTLPAAALVSRPVKPDPASPSLAALLDRYQPEGEAETADVQRTRTLAETVGDPWQRELPLHVTASALIVHPPTARVLLRWHQRQRAWLQVGGHGDPGETDPLAIARREAAEETGLADLAPWPDERLRHLVIVGVPAGKGEPPHEHADLRYFMATQAPDTARAENDDAPLRWLSLAQAREATSEANLLETMARMKRLLAR
jgi:8-oxo-dGTP pyrophosphatase MutT (NUDIX family)